MKVGCAFLWVVVEVGNCGSEFIRDAVCQSPNMLNVLAPRE